ncbi:MAG: sulfurtransferase-like selenium metabolism protein YedF [Treponema sp.]
MIEINAMGLECPQPVIKAKQAMNENTKKDDILVRVDNEVAVQNLTKLGKQAGAKVETKEISKKEYTVLFNFTETSGCQLIEDISTVKLNDYVVAISGDKMGQGEDELGLKLAESFVYALTEQDIKPKMVVCYNSGVFLTSKNEKTIADLKKLEEAGCEILSCGLCLDYYKLKESLKVGTITNMYRIVEILRTHNVVRP